VLGVETQISRDLDATAYRSKYDECCKSLLAHKSILAHILKECVSEFKDCDVKYIAENCIESEPEISKVNVHRNGKLPEKITGMSTEDKTVDEGSVYYDICFVAVLPGTNESIKLIINIEAQNAYYPGYSLVKRGLYYCCRLISAQHETEFTGNEYDNIKKVYSVWICTKVPENVRNTIRRYKITEENIIGNVKEDLKNYDILNVIMVCLDKDSENTETRYGGILKLLRILLSDKVNPKDKKIILDDDFGIEMNVNLEKEMDYMCNLSTGVWEDGVENGIKQGIEISTLKHLKSIMKMAEVSFEKAAIMLNIPKEEWEKYRDKL
jgi:hypothetical protein